MALLNPVNFEDQMGVGRVLFETDNVMLKQAMSFDAYDHAPLGILFKELKMKLANQFIHARVVHAPRDCNK